MPSGLSVKLPLTVDNTFGAYNLNTTFPELAKQNLKMLILTNPGERMMHPNFGVGLRQYLFEPNTEFVYDTITSNVRTQVSRYLPYIGIQRIDYEEPTNAAELDPNFVGVKVFFTILPLHLSALLQINVLNN